MTGVFRPEWTYYQPQRLNTVPAAVADEGGPFNPQRFAALRDPDEGYFQQKDRRTADLVATPANDLAIPLLGAFGDGQSYWQVYNEAAEVRSRAFYELEQRRRDTVPEAIAADAPTGLGSQWSRWRRDPAVSQQALRRSAYGLLDTALLEVPPPLSCTYGEAASYRDRRLVPQYTLRKSPAGLLEPFQLEVPPPLVDPAAARRREPWLRQKQIQADQSSAALVDFDPSQAGYKLSPAAFQRLPWLRQSPVQADQSMPAVAFARVDLHSSYGQTVTAAYTTSSFTPPDNSLLVVAFMALEDGGATPMVGDLTIADSVGLTWTSWVQETGDDSADGAFTTGVRIWTAPVTTGVSMTLTADCGARNINFYFVSAVAYTGYNTSSPVGATGLNNKSAGPWGPPDPASLTLNASPASSSEVFAAVVISGDPTVTSGSGWTEVHDSGDTTGFGGGETQARGGSTSTSVDWVDLRTAGTGNIFNYAAVAVEIKSAGGGAPETIPWAASVWQAAVTHLRKDWLRQKQITIQLPDDAVAADPLFNVDDPARHRRWYVRPWFGLQRESRDNQGTAATGFDPTLTGYGWVAEFMPATHKDRRHYPAQRSGIQVPDEVLTVGTGAMLAWWGVDDTAHHFAQWLPTFSVPEQPPGTPADPLILIDSARRERVWFARPWFGLQRQAIIMQGITPDVADPTQVGYGPRWLWYRAPVAPVQRDRESPTGLLLTALLEDPLLGAWDDILRHRAWHVDRREVPQQRSYPDAIQPPADPLLVGGAEWRWTLIPATHAPRWVLRQWWQQQMFQGADPVLFEGTVVGGTFSGPGSTGGNRDSYVIGGRQ